MNGFLLINKPSGLSSSQVVQKIKKLFKVKKIGHLGTLDPLATGLLVLAFNRATKFSNYFLESDKHYDVEIALGTSTDTDDSEGDVIFKSALSPNEDEIMTSLLSFQGDSMQVPPFFSALKHKGIPLYKYARRGEYIKKNPRKITIHKIDNVKITDMTCKFSISCSKGTYIRSIARDLGEKLKCGAHMTALRRVQQHEFRLSQAKEILYATLKDLITIEKAFKSLDSIKISKDDTKKFINGVEFKYQESQRDCVKVYNDDNKFLGLGEVNKNFLKHKQLV